MRATHHILKGFATAFLHIFSMIDWTYFLKIFFSWGLGVSGIAAWHIYVWRVAHCRKRGDTDQLPEQGQRPAKDEDDPTDLTKNEASEDESYFKRTITNETPNDESAEDGDLKDEAFKKKKEEVRIKIRRIIRRNSMLKNEEFTKEKFALHQELTQKSLDIQMYHGVYEHLYTGFETEEQKAKADQQVIKDLNEKVAHQEVKLKNRDGWIRQHTELYNKLRADFGKAKVLGEGLVKERAKLLEAIKRAGTAYGALLEKHNALAQRSLVQQEEVKHGKAEIARLEALVKQVRDWGKYVQGYYEKEKLARQKDNLERKDQGDAITYLLKVNGELKTKVKEMKLRLDSKVISAIPCLQPEIVVTQSPSDWRPGSSGSTSSLWVPGPNHQTLAAELGPSLEDEFEVENKQ